MQAALLEETEETEEASINVPTDEISDLTSSNILTKEEPIFLVDDIKEDPDGDFESMPDFPADLDILSFVSMEPEVVVKEEPELHIYSNMDGIPHKEDNFNFFDSCDELNPDVSDEDFNPRMANYEPLPSSSAQSNSPDAKKIKPTLEFEKLRKRRKEVLTTESDEEISDKRRTFECEFCKQTFLHERSLIHHLALKHPADGALPPKPLKKPHVCPICNVVRSHSRANIRRHIESVHEKKRAYHCKPCNISFGWERSLRNHNEHFHAKVGQPAERKYTCKDCDMEFNSAQRLMHHQKKVHDLFISGANKHFECTICSTRFAALKNLQRHYQQKHSDVSESEIQMFKCQHCVMTFATTEEMLQHMVEKHDHEKKFNCEICQVSYFIF